MRAQMLRERLLGRMATMPEAQERHIPTDWELTEEEVWEMGSLHGALPGKTQTGYPDTALSKAQQRAMATSKRYSNLLPRSRSSLSLAAPKHVATSAALDVPARDEELAIEAAAGPGDRAEGDHHARGLRRAMARSLNVIGISKKLAGGSYGDEDDDDDDDDGEENAAGMTPPHVIASRQRTAMACSVMEGAGRTLKGRDLRNVRNAVWKHTGFYG
ncbi:hypothetical protein L7F22_000803 [Adiantum nelumboides]|nr:hypothetical protein [Adiantum nelumboides]